MIDWMIRTFFDKKDKPVRAAAPQENCGQERILTERAQKNPAVTKTAGRVPVREMPVFGQPDLLALFDNSEGLNTYERKRAKAERLLRERAQRLA